MEISQLDFRNQQKSFLEKEEESKPLKEEEWICERCEKTNTMTDDPKSALCVGCGDKNAVIAFMIQAKAGQESKVQKEHLDQFSKTRGKVQGTS